MPSNKELLFQNHVAAFLEKEHQYNVLEKNTAVDETHHIIKTEVLQFIKTTQSEKYAEIAENYKTDTDEEIIKALKEAVEKKPLWLIMRSGILVKGTRLELYKPKPRSATAVTQEEYYQKNKVTFKTEYRYNPKNEERIDLVIWLNGLPIIVTEFKHEDEGQNCEDAIYESFLKRDFDNLIYKLPFLYVAASNTEVKVATNPTDYKNFRWFNAQLTNKAETVGEYPVEHLYRHAFSKENLVKYLEYFLVFVPAKEKITEDGEVVKQNSFTIFPRYHQLRASQAVAKNVLQHVNKVATLNKKYLINHSAGSGKTLTIAWLEDLLDGLYDGENNKLFDNIIILTDRKSLDKNIKDDLELFAHLKSKIGFSQRSKNLAEYLKKDKPIIVSTIHKFSYLQDKLQDDAVLKNRKVAFLIDEAHRSQEGKLALQLRKTFTEEGEESVVEAELEPTTDELAEELSKLNTSNQVFVAFTATTTAKTLAFFGEPFDVYTEEEAIQEGYILDVAQNIISYKTLYNLKSNVALPDKDYPVGLISKMLKNIAYNDSNIIEYKSEVIVDLFLEKVVPTINGRGKAMVVTSSRVAGLKYFETIKTILEEKDSAYKVLYAFSDFDEPSTNKRIEESAVNELTSTHSGKNIEDVFEQDEYRIMVVANKFQTGFDQPLLSAMFLDKAVNGVNAIQTVSRLNRKHKDKEQADILVVDFTNNSKEIFEAFNKHRKGTPFKATEPKKENIEKLYRQITDLATFTIDEVKNYVELFVEAEYQAKVGISTADALLSETNQKYRELFKERVPKAEVQKEYLSLLGRYIKIYYFIAQFYELEAQIHEFVVFAETMSITLNRRGKTSELTQLLKNVELKKGAVKYEGLKTNLHVLKEDRKTGLANGSKRSSPPRTTIAQAIVQIEEQFSISKEDALVIKEICEEVSKNYDVKIKIEANKDNEPYLKNNANVKVKGEVKESYIKRELWEKLEDKLYNQRGGIFSLMSKAIIEGILKNIA